MTATVEQDATEHQDAGEHHRIAIVGSGFAGLGMAVKLKQAGIEDFVLLERTGDVGGTWHLNTYPGCQCDIPSHLYSFSLAPNPDCRAPTHYNPRSGSTCETSRASCSCSR
jgi:cation diffusion facilitator CzcD-associated flavoprotein CzcO